MRKIKYLIIICLLIVVTLSKPTQAQMYQPDEELEYKVSYLGINLGTIKFVNEGYQTVNGKKVCKSKAYINSNPGIPFVSLHVIFESWYDMSVTHSHKFAGHNQDGNEWLYEELLFDYNYKRILINKWKQKKLYYTDTIWTSKKWNDGLSLFYLARNYVHSKKKMTVGCHVNDTMYTTINFFDKKENVEIDAVNYPIKTSYLNGSFNGIGIYGLSGKYEGWFSDDQAAIPIKAYMKLYVGNAKIELVKWKRKDWYPPKG